MTADTPNIRFEPLTEQAFPTLHTWLGEPHVRKWWGDPDHELALMRYFLTSDTDHGFVVHVDDEPVGYIQNWTPSHFIDDEPWASKLPTNAVAIDVFIGSPEKSGQGLGPLIIQAFCEKLFAEGATYLVIDPDARNKRAIKAYGKAGFEELRKHQGPDGVVVIMDLTELRFQRTT